VGIMNKSINPNVLGLCKVGDFCPWELFNLTENSFVVDLGAFRGEFSQYILSTYNCRVDAYEPSDMVYPITHPKYKWIKMPIWDGSPVLFNKNKGAGGHIFEGHGVEMPSVDIREVTKEHIDLLKVNIEGAELRVLGLADLSNVDQIVVEFHLFRAHEKDKKFMQTEIDGVLNRIMSFGYKMIQIDNTSPAYMFYDKIKI
jgi:hypothetical protein